jgi:hypothetical protein
MMHEDGEPAIGGYDVVSYFEGRPLPGTSEHAAEWNGRQWLFANAEHRSRFLANPPRYAPQFDGQCAFATSVGKEARGSPRHWLVRDGKLYLALNPVARLLFRLLPGRRDRAEANWKKRRTGR